MARLKVPSLQHMSRNWYTDSLSIKKALVSLALNPPTFNYNPLFSAVRDMLVFRQPYEDIVTGIRRCVKRPQVQQNFLEILPLLRDHFDGMEVAFVQSVDSRLYSIGRGLMVPFNPPLIYGLNGRIYFPWFSFWRRNPLEGMRLSLFVSLVDEILSQDPDLDAATFEVFDFSAASAKRPRELRIIDTHNIPRLSDAEKRSMLNVFAEGYFLAQQELSDYGDETRNTDSESAKDANQPDLFE